MPPEASPAWKTLRKDFVGEELTPVLGFNMCYLNMEGDLKT
jgi:hypothetical protein